MHHGATPAWHARALKKRHPVPGQDGPGKCAANVYLNQQVEATLMQNRKL